MGKTISRGRKRAVFVVAVVLTITGAGSAVAYWSSTGHGSGSATTGQSVAFTISSETAVGDIAPGTAGETVQFTLTNPGTGSQHLTQVTVTLASAEGIPWVPSGTCQIGDYAATITTPPPSGDIIAGGSVIGEATVTLANSATNQDDCQGQVVPLYFVAS